ncbi:hypothetical protein AB0M02_14720 [Actinoplanes sp. NPDC051861]|uniref:hypothetical protein n=1 Tax=Actinoplanes sp. NPDC051861 TaxID=3155170 RepID=UPI003426A6CB
METLVGRGCRRAGRRALTDQRRLATWLMPTDAFQRQAPRIMGGGWRSHVMRALEADLATS